MTTTPAVLTNFSLLTRDSHRGRHVRKAGRESEIQALNTPGHLRDAESASLLEMVREILVAERIAIEIYSEIIRNLGNDNPTTRIMIENIVAKEEEHAENLKSLLIAIGKM